MDDMDKVPEIKQILGALIFGASRALKVSEMRKCLVDVATNVGGDTEVFAKVKDRDVMAALKELDSDMHKSHCGFHLKEVAGGYIFQSDASCGKWLKSLLDKGHPDRLSRPALETLSIIAYRQPVTKASIESIRGVDVSHMIKTLMEVQLVKIAGRSELPGKPFLYATTNTFLEHFGLKGLNELSEIEPMLILKKEKAAPAKVPAKDEAQEPVFEGFDADSAEQTQEAEPADKTEEPVKPEVSEGEPAEDEPVEDGKSEEKV